MSVTMNLHPRLQHLTNGQAVVKVKGNTVGQCLDNLVRQFPKIKPWLFYKKDRLRNYVDIYINQKSAYPEELSKAVRDGDELNIMFLVIGG